MRNEANWEDIRKSSHANFVMNEQKTNREELNKEVEENMDENFRKSFVFQLKKKDHKSNSKDKAPEEKDQLRDSLRKTTINLFATKSPVTVATIFKDQPIKFYYFDVQNIGKPKQSGFSFCSPCQSNIISKRCRCQISDDFELEISQQIKSEGKLLYFVNFNTLKANIEEQETQLTTSFLLSINQQLKLSFSSFDQKTSELLQFKRQLKVLIENSDGEKYQITSLSSCPQNYQSFYQRRYRSAIDFVQKCQTGDIILFRGNHFFGSVQRILTNSNYDHVGLLIKDPTYGVLIFESTGNSGVCLASWDYMVRDQLYKYPEQIVWRRLIGIERDYQFKKLIHQFVTANLHKKYCITLQKLMMKQSVLKSPSPQKNEHPQHYFCSQLVAKTYKNLGLLTTNTKDAHYQPSNKFYPYHFTARHKLHLLKGQLSQEYKIHFDDDQIKGYY